MRNASPSGDAVGRDKINNDHSTNYYLDRKTQIDGWIEKLSHEMRNDTKTQIFVDSLQYYFQAYTHDDIIGLEAKLEKAGRSRQKISAMRKKEAFSKLLSNWSAYPAAQEIIAYFLAKIDTAFESYLVPVLETASSEEVDILIKNKLVDPVLQEMGCGPFMLNNNIVSGMVYWLAEKCYIRWHK